MRKKDNQAKLKDLGVEGKERYYYLKYGKGAKYRPDGFMGVATICLLPVPACDGDTILRGISFCSPLDQFVRKVGRARALGRAIKALEQGSDSEPVPSSGAAALLRADNMLFLSGFNPTMTAFEQKLIEPPEKSK